MSPRQEAIHTLYGTLELFPDYTVVEWRGSDLRDRLRIIIDLPSGVRIDGIVYGVVDDGNTFELKVDKAKELLNPHSTLRKRLKVIPKENGGFDINHPNSFVIL